MNARSAEIVHDADAPRDTGLAPDALTAQLDRTWDIPRG
jgi:hypothetical protein